MSTREQNERKFPNWEELPEGGRRYWLDIPGRRGWRARYVKEVDAEENTLRFYNRFTTAMVNSWKFTRNILWTLDIRKSKVQNDHSRNRPR